LFLVSSKSGGTVETISLYQHFRGVVAQAVGEERAGRHFVAITDPGTSLATLGHQMGFRRVFLSPADIGGRYSVLSLFGLAPAALMGIDLPALLGRAEEMQSRCAPEVPAGHNPGAWLGAALGAMATHGRDKLTLACSPATASFGLWVEQLIAESLGKEGKGIVPVVDEPMAPPEGYGADRFFAYARLEGDDNAELDSRLERLAAAGQPVVCLEWRDRLELAGEFYRWEFATAVAGAMLGLNPFDQPDVQGAKDTSERVLRQFHSSRIRPAPLGNGSLRQMLDAAPPGSYLGILAYLAPTPGVDYALTALRRRVRERWGLPVTLGYGPRYLHSTGQLHKGGPPSGQFLLLTQDHPQDIPIPGQEFSFGQLADAQALGDLTTLQGLGRPAVHRRLGADPVARLGQLLDELGE
ncbi:MAG TPA: glucose-6-phosphate isomerase, partial [Dehalococcoidia bacterium]|nr:glucose-6-phosphate isomerase [Dehalococcoidia bacterium]